MTARLPEEPTCQQIVELVTDYLEGGLSLEDRTEFEMGNGECGMGAEGFRMLAVIVGGIVSRCGNCREAVAWRVQDSPSRTRGSLACERRASVKPRRFHRE